MAKAPQACEDGLGGKGILGWQASDCFSKGEKLFAEAALKQPPGFARASDRGLSVTLRVSFLPLWAALTLLRHPAGRTSCPSPPVLGSVSKLEEHSQMCMFASKHKEVISRWTSFSVVGEPTCSKLSCTSGRAIAPWQGSLDPACGVRPLNFPGVHLPHGLRVPAHPIQLA